MQTDILIVGGGVSGLAMAAVAKKNFPDKTVLIVTEESPSQDIVFHLHRPIADLPELTDKKTIKFRSSVYTDSGITLTPTIKDINSYAEKVFNKLFITNCGNSPEFTIIPVGIQDIEDSIDSNLWVEIINHYYEGILVIDINFINQIKESIPIGTDVPNNKKFFKKLEASLRKKWIEDGNDVDEFITIPTKGEESANFILEKLVNKDLIPEQIKRAFDKLIEL